MRHITSRFLFHGGRFDMDNRSLAGTLKFEARCLAQGLSSRQAVNIVNDHYGDDTRYEVIDICIIWWE